ncbi:MULTISPECIES: carboxypeptidase M32 [Vibrio]|jgi:carboxypeptidase Taq|uniref:Metal-dependent carboxypeptidase n=2 Tax=Vibrio alginolyticus TaxID=663 RepID=A0A0P7EQD7_VIBAL|nr:MULTISPECIES: carboxypeptidase M32 [Vibrio]MDW1807959.1 carboxypeptidase M32 [Vibrio sp. Vb2362]NAW92993.1 carboxypeptidase M32 [Vibrio sp. V42_P2S4T144]QIR88409.1 carboxypeptidase M32 [Vibrio diabolicus]EAS77620.1 thermostable carboxypeptidase 1 [Vibrio alginolyticus 12G01]EGQ7760520.1 carboxypeptidase M32 [Vibrio alginolyticus]
MNAFTKLVEHSKKVANFEHLSAIIDWDQAAVMPPGGAEARSNATAELDVHIHSLMTQPHLGELFAQAEEETLSTKEKSILREMKRGWQQANLLPESLVQAQSLAGSKCEHAWRTQRGENDWAGFEKNWAEVVKLSQEEAQIRAEANGTTPYDAMLDVYEPGTTSASLDILFADVKTWLPTLIDEALEKQQSDNILLPTAHYPAEKQKALGLEVMKLLQFDFEHGRLDESTHPFCGGVPTDVRITTRYNENEFVQSLMGIVHETGHARYEQGLPKDLSGTPAGEARSMGIHESQSLFFEMQIGRSSAFIDHLARLASNHFSGSEFEKDNLAKIYTRVEKGFIRVDADELTYPAHVILRYEIERDLMNGVIKHTDVPELWNEKMKAYLGLSTEGNFKNGCMQDIHWTDGSFGYFPSYTLGAMYAAQFMAAMKQTVDVDAVIRSGDLAPIFNWLSENIWSKGSLFTTDELVKQATGETLNAKHFQAHLKDRYL